MHTRNLRFEHVDIKQRHHNGWRSLVRMNHTIGSGDILTVMGPSGVGKSTLLNWAAGLLSADFSASGRLWLNERELTHLPTNERNIGLLFQDALLFPHLSVAGNLAFGMPKDKGNRAEKIEQALHRVGLAGMGLRDPATLSGGQQARVALLRVLLSNPDAILLDEPFSKLDATLRDDMRQWVFDTIRDAGLPALMVTHDRADAEHAQGVVIELSPSR